MTDRDPAVEGVLAEVLSDVRLALGDGLVGMYVYGSYVSGGFEPGVSDIDIVAVTAADAGELDFTALDCVHRDIVDRHPDWEDRLEIVYVGEDAVRSFRTSPSRVAVISPGEPFHLRDEPVAEWIQNWYLVRETGRVLYGPPAASLIPGIEWSEFVAAAVRYADEVSRRDLGDARAGAVAYAVLTMCRALMTVETDRHPSKQEAAAWGQARLPAWAPLIDAALRCRLSRGAIEFDDVASRREAREFIGVVASLVGSH